MNGTRGREFRLAGEAVRVGLLAALAVALTRPLLTGLFVGGTDARWYATMLREYLGQERSGRFVVLAGQGIWDWTGGIHPFRSAPMFCYVAGLWDLLTFRSLGVFALQHLTALTSALSGAVGFYAAAAAILPRRRWEAMLLAVLYVGAPVWLAILYRAEAAMTFMALGVLPLALYGNARALLSPGGRGYPQIAAGLALLWMCHPPVALLTTLLTALIQGGKLLFGRPDPGRLGAAVRSAGLFLGFGAFYFTSMSELPAPQGSLGHDLIQVAGLALALAGIVRGVLRGSRRWFVCLAAGAALLAFASVPWLVWMAVAAALAAAAAFLARRLWGFDPARRAAEIVFPTLLISAGAADALLEAASPGTIPGSCLGGLAANSAHWEEFFLPVSALHTGSDYQPGAGLWIFLGLLGLAFFRTRSAASKLFFAAGFLPVLGLIRVPWVSAFLAGTFPPALAGIGSFPLVLRLVPVMAGFLAMGGVVWLACEGPGPFGRAGPLTLLVAAVCAGLAQDRVLVDAGRRVVATPEMSRDLFLPENLLTPHFDYDLLPAPSTFWEGAVDPRLEFRLLGADKAEYSGPDDCARRMEARGATTLRLVARHDPAEGSNWLEFSPEIDVAPGEHLLLRFEFDSRRDATGWLIFQGRRGYREYHLPFAGLSRGFGTGPACSHVISLWNSTGEAERYRVRMTREAGNDVTAGSVLGTVVVSRYDDALNPVRVRSLDPLRLDVDAAKSGWLETVRAFLPGYRAWVDGRPAPVFRSPETLAMVPISAGRHTVELRYGLSAKLWLAGVLSAVTWAGWLVGLRKGGRRAAANEPAAEAPCAPDPLSQESARRDAEAVRRLRSWLYRGLLGLTVAAVLAFYAWTIATSGLPLRAGEARGEYYPELAQGFHEGHLYMTAQVDPALAALPEDQRPGNAPYLLDASLYRGRYYLYFGAAPVVLLFWPWLALTGWPLPEALAAAIFAAAGFGLAAAWWLSLRRRLFPDLPGRWAVLGVLAIGICSAAGSALRRPMFYEVAICSGYAFTMLALWAGTRALFDSSRRRRWLGLCGVAGGLAVGSRANLGPAEVLLAVAASAAAARAALPGRRRRAFLSGLGAAAAGLGAIGLCLAAYNFARFGDPLDFGHRFQLGVNPRRMFHAANLPYNLDLYYLRPPALNGYFPFVGPAKAPPPPPDYIGREHLHGEWVWLPLVCLAAASFAFLAASRRRAAGTRADAPGGDAWPDPPWLIGLPLLLFLVNVLIVSAAGSRANRYLLDFQPALVLATLAALAPALAGRGPFASAVRLLAGAGIAVAALFNVLASVQAQGFYPAVRPGDYRRLAAEANRMVWPWLRSEAEAVGDRELRVRWPGSESGLGGAYQPLLATGTAGFEDVLLVEYDGGNRARFVCQHGDYGGARGDWFSITPGGLSTVRLDGAMLLPPPGHPWYAGRRADVQAVLKKRLRVTVDGVVRFDRDVPSYDSSPSLQRWGAWRAPDTAVERRFTGQLDRPATLAPDESRARALLSAQGAIRLSIELPQDRFGAAEPLYQSGSVEAFDTLAVVYVDRSTVRLVHDTLGGGAVYSDPIRVDYDRPQRVEIETPLAWDGLFWPDSQADPVPRRLPPERLSVWWNGRHVFTSRLPLHEASVASIAIGGSTRRFSGARMLYSGGLGESPRREPLGAVSCGVLRFRPPAQNPFGDDRGVLVRFDRRDGESASLVWRRGSTGLQFGWADVGSAQWSAPVAGGEEGREIALSISAPQAVPDVIASADVVRQERIVLGIGGRRILDACTDLFSQGEVRATAILPERWRGGESGAAAPVIAPPSLPRLPGRIRFIFRLLIPIGGSQPILETGRPLKADSVYLRRLADGRYVLGLDHWGVGARESKPVVLSSSEPHTLLIELGSLFSAGSVRSDLVRLTLDGAVALETAADLYPARPGEVWIGRNPLGMSTSDAAFRGEILSIRTRQPPRRR